MSNSFDFSKLVDFSRIFQATPGVSFEFKEAFLIFFGLLLFTASALRIALRFQKSRIYKKLFRKISNLNFTISLLGFFYLFARSENIYLFSGRFVLIAILLTFLAWAGFIGFYAFFRMPKELERHKKQLLIKKYLPKRKKK